MRSLTGGTAILLLLSACGGGGGGAAVQPVPPAGAGPAVVQTNVVQTGGATDFQTNTQVSFIAPTKAGGTIWVAATVPNVTTHTISVTDSQGNTYTKLDQENDGSPGIQSVAHFYAANIAGDTATPDVVTVNWDSDNYKGVLIAEISGATQAPLVGHAANIQHLSAAGTDNVSAGPVNVSTAQTPALVLALSMNTYGGTSDLGGSGFGGPTAGSGLTQKLMLWNWGTNLATFATVSVTGAESVSSLFNAPNGDPFVTVVAVFH